MGRLSLENTKSFKLTSHGAKFEAGAITLTPGFMDKSNPKYALTCLAYHLTGDWGLVGDEDWAKNDRALEQGDMILSSYPLPDEGGEFWIITEHDRSITTFLLPEEY